MRIWVDADATPKAIKEILFRASDKRKIPLTLVANTHVSAPKRRIITQIVVAAGDDKADDYIVENAKKGDLAITADIPLAARLVEIGCNVITPRGAPLEAENVRERLSVRNFSHELRAMGLNTGGPPPLDKKTIQRFANALDRWISRAISAQKR